MRRIPQRQEVVPPTDMSSIFNGGCPTPTGTRLPQTPTPSSSVISLSIIETRLSTSGPEPINVAPLTGRVILPS